jgi:WD40 repeat protein
VASCVVSHPSLPFYLVAGVDGSVCLHQYNFPELLTPYRVAPCARVNGMKFCHSGSRFGAVDEAGNLALWQFDSSFDSQRPFSVFACHSKRANDLCFLDSGNVVGTAGLSSKSSNAASVSVWDTLISPSKGLVAAFAGHPKGATTLVYSDVHRLLVSGGKTGEICVWDMRMQKLLSSFPAHSLNVRSLALDASQSVLASGSSDGNLKVWSLPEMSDVATFSDAHKQQTFTKNQSRFLTSPISTFGVMNVVFWKNKLLSSGADGRLTSREYLY